MKNIKTYIPVLALTAIIATSAPFIRPVNAKDPNLNNVKAAAVVFSATEDYEGGSPVGYSVYLFQASANAPQPTMTIGSPVADMEEFYLARGFTIQSSDGFVFRMVRLPSPEQIVRD